MITLQIQNLTADELQELIAKAVSNALNESGQEKNQQKSNNYLSRKETASKFHISLPTLNEWTRTGKVPAYRIGGRVLYKEDEVGQSLTQIESLKYKRG